MKRKRHLRPLLLLLILAALCASPAYALEYSFDGAEDYPFGSPTTDDSVYTPEATNVDRSKSVALVPPGFGTPTSYLPGSGTYLTPNLVPGALSGGLVSQVGSVNYSAVNTAGGYPSAEAASGYSTTDAAVSYPAADVAGNYPSVDSFMATSTADLYGAEAYGGYTEYTEVTSDLYYSNGSLGTLQIPSIGLNVKIFQGTDSTILAKGVGHFEDTSIWGGNVCLAAHNRGANNYFGQIHTLNAGDKIVLTTNLGTRTFAVTSVDKIGEQDNTMLGATSENCITLFTCVRDEREYRWCVRGIEV